MPEIKNIPTLKLHRLSKEQYDRELAADNLDPDALYLTPETTFSITFDNFDTVVEPGFYRAVETGASRYPTEFSGFKYASLLVETNPTYHNGELTTEIHQTATTSNYVAKRYSISNGKNWTAWEYVNPPLASGYEYRTTERFFNKPVYASRFELVDISFEDGKFYHDLPANIDMLVRIEGCVKYTDELNNIHTSPIEGCFENIEVINSPEDGVSLFIEGSIHDNSTISAVLYYTKTT